ncbi:hypothetical protein RSOL_343870, partial [Rhizoctonia solani AG-3 Rhs1AP]
MPHRGNVPHRRGQQAFRQRNQDRDRLVNALVRNNNFIYRADLVRAETEHIRVEEAREQRLQLLDVNRDYGHQPPAYYGQPGPQDNMPVTPTSGKPQKQKK